MKPFLNIILLVCFLFFFTKNIRAQDSQETGKMKRNCIKVGTTSLIKYYLSYEHAVAKHFSAGVMASYNTTLFPGFTGTVFTRFYFSSFDKSGWFAEAKGSYSYFAPTTYSDYDDDPKSLNNIPILHGEHQGSVDYRYAGISGGYKFVLSKQVFFECLTGIHYGKATFGSNDTYMYGPDFVNIELRQYNTHDMFYLSGPGYPFHIMLNFGFTF